MLLEPTVTEQYVLVIGFVQVQTSNILLIIPNILRLKQKMQILVFSVVSDTSVQYAQEKIIPMW